MNNATLQQPGTFKIADAGHQPRVMGRTLRALRMAVCAAAILPSIAGAELYCVSNSTQLANAVAGAGASPGNSEIRVATGSYTVAASGGAYALIYRGEGDLLLTGGWTGANCQTRSTLNPELTVIGTGNTGKLMEVDFPFSRAGTIEISGIAFRSSTSPDAEPACLLATSQIQQAERHRLYLDRNSFRLCNSVVDASGPSTLEIDARYTDVYLRNNVFADNGGYDDVVRLIGRGDTTMYVSNNTIAFNPAGSGRRDGLSINGSDSTSFFWIVNNVASNNGNPSSNGHDFFVQGNIGTTGVVAHNLFRRVPVLSSNLVTSNNLSSDPLLANSVDLRPTAQSPLRNSGNGPVGGALAFDSLGQQRVQGGTIDRGAFEFEELFANGFE